MPEGVAVAGGPVISGAVHDDPDRPPEPSEEAPRGWTWNRTDRKWQPKIRGKVLWQDDGGELAGRDDRADAGASDGPGQAGSPAEGRDPAPAWARDDARPDGKRRLSFDEVPQNVKDDIAGLGGLVATPILALLQQADPYCGTALAQSFEPIVDATLPLICRSQRIVRYFSDDKADWLLWGKLAVALAPVGRAIAEHHLFRAVETVLDTETGKRTWRPVTADEGHGDHLQPRPQPEQYAA